MLAVHLPDRLEDDIYDHVSRLCPHLRSASAGPSATNNSNSTQSPQISSNDFFPSSPNLFSPEGHRTRLRNWNSLQLDAFAAVLLPLVSSQAINVVLPDVSRSLVKLVDTL